MWVCDHNHSGYDSVHLAVSGYLLYGCSHKRLKAWLWSNSDVSYDDSCCLAREPTNICILTPAKNVIVHCTLSGKGISKCHLVVLGHLLSPGTGHDYGGGSLGKNCTTVIYSQ